jgi:hypothetical protein
MGEAAPQKTRNAACNIEEGRTHPVQVLCRTRNVTVHLPFRPDVQTPWILTLCERSAPAWVLDVATNEVLDR